jgi:hypothetical protein
MTFAEKSADGVFNGSTAVDIVPVPASSHTLVVRNITAHNADTVACTVTLYYNDNGTLRKLVKQALDPDATLIYEVIQVLDATTKKIQGVLAGAHTSTAPSFVASYGDVS